MKFGDIEIGQAEGAILAHGIQAAGIRFKKGRVLTAADVDVLRRAGVERVMAARLEPGDLDEDMAAARVAEALRGPGLEVTAAFTGRVNLVAEEAGVVTLDPAALDALNLIDEAMTVATVPPFEVVKPRQMVATVKVIPFAVPETVVRACEAAARNAAPMVAIRAFRSKSAALIQTRLPGTKESVLDKTVSVMQARLAALGAKMAQEDRCPHETEALTALIQDAKDQDMILIAGASAITDRRDVIPAAIEAAGGAVDHFGMPVDPGNLLLMGHLDNTPVLGLPGCARSPKLNGFDWVLQRLCANLPVVPGDIMRMGPGGLLKEIPSRPLPRAEAGRDRSTREEPPTAPRIGALVLAAGQSRRMGATNKLTAEIDGVPMVMQVCETVLASKAEGMIVVTGHQRDAVRQALSAVDTTFVHNPAFAEGLSSSLCAGLAAVPEGWDGVVVCLGDMPRVTTDDLNRLIAAFNPVEGRAICVPTHNGKRGNPVLWGRQFFDEIRSVAGDVGARHLIGAYREAVCEVEMASDAVLHDIDTPDALDRARR